MNPIADVTNYFIDESGQAELFAHRGHPLVIGESNQSRFFYIGCLFDENPQELNRDLVRLRRKLIIDSYFRYYAMMKPSNKKTFCALHANDDSHEVRWSVYSYLRKRKNMRFFAVVRDKKIVLAEQLAARAADPHHVYSPDKLYANMLTRLMKPLATSSPLYTLHVARRTDKKRDALLIESLLAAVKKAQFNFQVSYGRNVVSDVNILPKYPSQHAGLQAADYFLWALQRAYEKQETGSLEYIYHHFRLVMDVDDTRRGGQGFYYNGNKGRSISGATIVERLSFPASG